MPGTKTNAWGKKKSLPLFLQSPFSSYTLRESGPLLVWGWQQLDQPSWLIPDLSPPDSMLKCPWARHRTRNCSWWAGHGLAWQLLRHRSMNMCVSAYVCVCRLMWSIWKALYERSPFYYQRGAFTLVTIRNHEQQHQAPNLLVTDLFNSFSEKLFMTRRVCVHFVYFNVLGSHRSHFSMLILWKSIVTPV